MIPVADSGPLISLARVGQLTLLRAVLPQLIVPRAVYTEVVSQGAGRPGAAELDEDSGWLTVQNVADPGALTGIRASLHAGEREVLGLALELGGWPVLMDERAGRLEAQRLGLPTITTLNVLQQAREDGHISAVRPIVEQLLATGFRIRAQVLAVYLQSLGED